MGLITSILVLSFLIFFHELGHFLAARLFGVKVETFSIGFGSKIYKKKMGDTEYCISAIPLGGYVQMKGQDDKDPTQTSNDPDSYNVKATWQRFLILFAGPLANFIIAFFLYFAIGIMGNQVLAPVVGEVKAESPAFKAGLQANDRIVEINQVPIHSWKEMSEYIKESEGRLAFIVERGKKLQRIIVNPHISDSVNIFGEKIQKRMVGISPAAQADTIHYSPIESIAFAWTSTIEAGLLIVQGIEKLITGIVPTSEVGGVISIVQFTSEASAMGIITLLTFTALISVNLGVLNLLPIPALDGGHIMFVLYEMVTGRQPSETILYRMTVGGWIILFGLMFLGLYNDINRLAMGTGLEP